MMKGVFKHEKDMYTSKGHEGMKGLCTHDERVIYTLKGYVHIRGVCKHEKILYT